MKKKRKENNAEVDVFVWFQFNFNEIRYAFSILHIFIVRLTVLFGFSAMQKKSSNQIVTGFSNSDLASEFSVGSIENSYKHSNWNRVYFKQKITLFMASFNLFFSVTKKIPWQRRSRANLYFATNIFFSPQNKSIRIMEHFRDTILVKMLIEFSYHSFKNHLRWLLLYIFHKEYFLQGHENGWT